MVSEIRAQLIDDMMHRNIDTHIVTETRKGHGQGLENGHSFSRERDVWGISRNDELVDLTSFKIRMK